MTLKRVMNGLVFCAIACLAFAPRAIASEYHGQVTFSGLPVPGTTVTATQGEKKVVAITDAQGVYSFPDLADGTWTIDVQMTGFAPLKQDVTIAPNLAAGTWEMKLLSLDQIRAAAKPVKVEAAPVMTASATTPSAPGAPTPTPGKGAAPAKTTSAAAADVPPAPAPDPNAQQASDGFLINGSVNNAATSQYALSQAFGNTRNGRSLYNYGLSLVLNNSALNARPYSLNGQSTIIPAYNNLVAGVSFGGPVKIPHLSLRNFRIDFANYQRTENNQESSPPELVPTLAQRSGDLSQQTAPIYAPAAGLSPACLSAGVTPGAPFPGNKIPAACISPVAQNLLSFYPAPNFAGSAFDNYQVALPSSTRADSFATRMSKSFGNKDYVFGGFNFQSTRSGNTNLFGFHDSTKQLNISGNVGWSHRFTQRVYMNLGYNFSRSRSQGAPYFANRLNIEGQNNILGVDTDPIYWGPPGLSFSSGLAGLSDGNSSYNRNETNGVNVEVNWNRSRHNVAIGGNFRRQESNYFSQSNPRGSFHFNAAATNGGVLTAGSDMADLLLAIPDTSSISYGNPDKYLRQSVYDLYARDDFRVNPELSINAGVRWEYGAPVTETQGRMANLDIAPGFTAESPVVANHPVGPLTGLAYPTSLVQPDKIGIAPNVGIAWRPISGSSLLIRAGYQIAHDTSVYQATALLMATQAFATPITKSLSLNNSACALTLTNGFSNCPSITPDNFAVDPNFRVGYAQLWTLSAQRDLPFSLQMIATYQGIKGTRGVQEVLPNTYPYGGTNPCVSCPSGFLYRTSNGNSTREGGVIQLRRRLRSGFTANLSYTFSKSLDDDYSFGGNSGSNASPQVAQDWRNPSSQRGLSTFDQRHLLAVQLQYTTGMGLGGRTLMSGWKGQLYKEWTILTNISAGSGTPETPTYTATVPGTGYSDVFRANYTGAPIHASTPGYFINPTAFTAPAAGFYGNARRDSIPGPGQFSLNASMARTFRVHDRYTLDAHIDATNLLNHVVYSSYYTTVSPVPNQLFGTPSNFNAMRSMSVTMRMRF